MNAAHPDPPPFWLLMLATMSRRYADFIAAVRHANRKGLKVRALPRQQIMRAWAMRRRALAKAGRHSHPSS